MLLISITNYSSNIVLSRFSFHRVVSISINSATLRGSFLVLVPPIGPFLSHLSSLMEILFSVSYHPPKLWGNNIYPC